MRARTYVLVAAPLLGCASLIGANFDEGELGPADAAVDAAGELAPPHDAPAESTTDASEFNPQSISGLVFWIDATNGVEVPGDAGAGPVARWRDRSPFGRHALPVLGAGTNPPTLVPGALGGKPVVRFVQAQADLLRTSWTGPAGTELTIFLAGRGYLQSALRFQNAFDVGSPYLIMPYDFAQDATSPSLRFLVGPGDGTYTDCKTKLDGSAAVVAATWHGDGTARTFLDGALVEQRVAGNPALPPNQILNIGGDLPSLGYTAQFADGDVAEAIVYSTALTDSQRALVEGYLLQKWAIGP